LFSSAFGEFLGFSFTASMEGFASGFLVPLLGARADGATRFLSIALLFYKLRYKHPSALFPPALTRLFTLIDGFKSNIYSLVSAGSYAAGAPLNYS